MIRHRTKSETDRSETEGNPNMEIKYMHGVPHHPKKTNRRRTPGHSNLTYRRSGRVCLLSVCRAPPFNNASGVCQHAQFACVRLPSPYVGFIHTVFFVLKNVRDTLVPKLLRTVYAACSLRWFVDPCASRSYVRPCKFGMSGLTPQPGEA